MTWNYTKYEKITQDRLGVFTEMMASRSENKNPECSKTDTETPSPPANQVTSYNWIDVIRTNCKQLKTVCR